jgi:predicted RNase H-like HicB family nuclease
MKAEDRYLKFVRWSDEDGAYVGFCPDLFPWGGVCHGADEEATYRQLCELVREEIDDLQATGKDLPQATTRPMREPAGV